MTNELFEYLDHLCPLHLRVDGDGVITHVGPTLMRLRDPEDLLGKHLGDVFRLTARHGEAAFEDFNGTRRARIRLHFRDPPETNFRGLLLRHDETGGAMIDLSFGIYVKDAVQTYGLKLSDFAATDAAFEMLFLIEANAVAMGAWREVAERLDAARFAAEKDARTDSLTGLSNRRTLEDAAHVIGDSGPVAVMLVDLDNFKEVNDRHGHAQGDEALQTTARILEDETRGGDFVLRTGGDEFTVVLPTVTDPNTLDAIASRILSRLLGGGHQDLNSELLLSASIGMAVRGPDEVAVLDELIIRADTALYASKAQGRGRATLTTAPEGFVQGSATPPRAIMP